MLALFAFVALIGGVIVYAVMAGKGTPPKSGLTPGSNAPLLSAAATETRPVQTPALEATTSVPAAAAAPTTGLGPKIKFATPEYDFGKVKAGDVVKYDYVFTNVGDQLLELTGVKASCGCTTAGEWTRQVEPGKTGSIPIQFSSANFNGTVGKSITVVCNETSQPTHLLQIKGIVWRPIEVAPQFAVLNVTAETPSNAATVRIVNNMAEPLTLWTPEINSPAFAMDLKTNQPGKDYELVVRTVPPWPSANLVGQITIKTSSTNVPVLHISAMANVMPLVQPVPGQIILPPPPLTNPTPYTVSVQNHSTNALALSEPTVNAKGVAIQLQEIQPGRACNVAVTFPAGFEVPPGQTVEVRLTSSIPQFPVVRIPVLQPPRAAALAAPASGPGQGAPAAPTAIVPGAGH
jgi:hypothetical protein